MEPVDLSLKQTSSSHSNGIDLRKKENRNNTTKTKERDTFAPTSNALLKDATLLIPHLQRQLLRQPTPSLSPPSPGT
jgi:hypothetical protein